MLTAEVAARVFVLAGDPDRNIDDGEFAGHLQAFDGEIGALSQFTAGGVDNPDPRSNWRLTSDVVESSPEDFIFGFPTSRLQIGEDDDFALHIRPYRQQLNGPVDRGGQIGGPRWSRQVVQGFSHAIGVSRCFWENDARRFPGHRSTEPYRPAEDP